MLLRAKRCTVMERSGVCRSILFSLSLSLFPLCCSCNLLVKVTPRQVQMFAHIFLLFFPADGNGRWTRKRRSMIHVHQCTHDACMHAIFKVTVEGIDFMVSHATVTSIQRLTHVKRGPCQGLSSVRHHGSVLQIHHGGRGQNSDLFSNNTPPFSYSHCYSPVELSAIRSLIENSKWGSPWRVQSIRVCRMVVACKVSLKQWLNFWTCHLAFHPCNCMWTLPAFVLHAEDGLCVNFSHLS